MPAAMRRKASLTPGQQLSHGLGCLLYCTGGVVYRVTFFHCRPVDDREYHGTGGNACRRYDRRNGQCHRRQRNTAALFYYRYRLCRRSFVSTSLKFSAVIFTQLVWRHSVILFKAVAEIVLIAVAAFFGNFRILSDVITSISYAAFILRSVSSDIKLSFLVFFIRVLR